jgi:hypothetical protein
MGRIVAVFAGEFSDEFPFVPHPHIPPDRGVGK